MSTAEREVARGCDKSDCSVKKCLCCCHEGMMDHMFACCGTMKCDKCGVDVPGTVVDGGTYYKD